MMKITHQHLEFFYKKKYGIPSFATVLKKREICINSLIPGNNLKAFDNTISLLRMKRKRQNIKDALLSLTTSTDRRRASDCRKWYNRIMSREGK